MQQNINITLAPNLAHNIQNSAKEQGIAKFRGILNNTSPEVLRSDYIQEKYNV